MQSSVLNPDEVRRSSAFGGARRAIWQQTASWVFSIAIGLFVVVGSIVTARRHSDSFGRRMVNLWGRGILRICGVRLQVEGLDTLSGRQPRIVVFNHGSLLDDFIVCSIAPAGSLPVVKREVLYYPVIGWVVGLLDFLLIDRNNHDKAMASLKEAAERISRERLTLWIAPEGTRSRDGSLGTFRLGALRLALASGAPIVPMIVHGAHDLLPRGQLWVAPGTVRVRFLPPISAAGLTEENLRQRSDDLRQIFVRELGATHPQPSRLA